MPLREPTREQVEEPVWNQIVGGNQAPHIPRRTVMGIIVWLVIGLIAGFVARAVVPGSDAMGIVGTIVLGLVGSVVGGFLGNLLVEGRLDLEAAGIIGSILGAIVALLIYRNMGRGRAI
jgi:uncharacterized membrane protein YeaQ/YmgE (transglycosylase-associated protein family)